jgi:mRNA-degrading endonuclease RelE of RelBE toxin-antitoxin system
LRIGDYRVIYRIEEKRVVVVRIAHRRDAYR